MHCQADKYLVLGKLHILFAVHSSACDMHMSADMVYMQKFTMCEVAK